MSWLESIKGQLDRQYLLNEAPFEAIFQAYNESLRREEATLDEHVSLEEQLSRLQNNLATAKSELDSLKLSGSDVFDSKKYHELDAKYRQVKQERMDLLRTQSQHSHKLLELNELIKGQEAIKVRLENEILKLQAATGDFENKVLYLEHLIEEKNLNIQILQDELQAIQLELLHTDERVKYLELENSQLVQRWLARVNETVERMNAEVSESSEIASQHNPYKVVATLELKKPITGLVTGINSDLILPITECDQSGRICLFRGKSSSTFITVPNSSDPYKAIFNHDASNLIAVGNRDADIANIWHIESGKLIGSLSGGIGNAFIDFTSMASTNEALIALHSQNSLRFYDVPRTFCLWTEPFNVPLLQVSSLQLKNSDVLSLLTKDGRIQLWDIRQRKLIRKSSHHVPEINSLSTIDSQENLLASTSNSVLVLDPDSLKVIKNISHPSISSQTANPSLSISPNDTGKFAITSKSRIVFGDYNKGVVEGVLSDHQFNLAGIGWISPENETHSLLVTADVNGNVLLRKLFD